MQKYNGIYNKYVKRSIDILLSLIGLPVFGIIFTIVAILIKIDDGGPVFYNAPRLGKNGQIFKMLKFRSMKVDSPDIRNSDGTTYNSDSDPRVTRTGKLLRKTSLDELPQLINVLKGEMSFVGPRPDTPEAKDKLYWKGVEEKLNVLPGITGYSQAYYRNSSTLQERFEGDLFYTKNISLILDIKIIFKTIDTVLGKKNIYRN